MSKLPTEPPKTEWDYVSALALGFFDFAHDNQMIEYEIYEKIIGIGRLEAIQSYSDFAESLIPQHEQLKTIAEKAKNVKLLLQMPNHGLGAMYPTSGTEVEMMWLELDKFVQIVNSRPQKFGSLLLNKYESFKSKGSGYAYVVLKAFEQLLRSVGAIKLIRESQKKLKKSK